MGERRADEGKSSLHLSSRLRTFNAVTVSIREKKTCREGFLAPNDDLREKNEERLKR